MAKCRQLNCQLNYQKKHVVHNPKFSIFIARVHESEDTDNYQAVLDLVAGK